MQLLKTLLLSLLNMFRALLAHHQELTKTVCAAYSDGMRYAITISCTYSFRKLLMMGEKCPKHVEQ